jgi:hypothetical protein
MYHIGPEAVGEVLALAINQQQLEPVQEHLEPVVLQVKPVLYLLVPTVAQRLNAGLPSQMLGLLTCLLTNVITFAPSVPACPSASGVLQMTEPFF